MELGRVHGVMCQICVTAILFALLLVAALPPLASARTAEEQYIWKGFVNLDYSRQMEESDPGYLYSQTEQTMKIDFKVDSSETTLAKSLDDYLSGDGVGMMAGPVKVNFTEQRRLYGGDTVPYLTCSTSFTNFDPDIGYFPNQITGLQFSVEGDSLDPTNRVFRIGRFRINPAGRETCSDGQVMDFGGPGYSTEYQDGAPVSGFILPARGPDGPTVDSAGNYRWRGTRVAAYTAPGGFFKSTESATWTYDLTLSKKPTRCQIAAYSPQNVRSGRLYFKVLGKDAGCNAELSSVALRINGKNRYRAKSSRSKKVGPGEVWGLNLRYGASKARVLRNAIKKGKKVTALITFDFDGSRKTKTVNLQ